MYAKIFQQIYTSSVAEDYEVRLVFMDLLVLADQDGVVDMTPEGIARVTNVPIEIVRRALKVLEQPDPQSRNPLSQGARIVRLDEHRDWGWMITNYAYYRGIGSEEQRRERTRLRVMRWRKRHAEVHGNAPVTHGNAPQRQETPAAVQHLKAAASAEEPGARNSLATLPSNAAVTHGNAGNAKQRQKQKQKDPPQPPAGGKGLPDQLAQDPAFCKTWEDFKRHRKEIRAALTPMAESRLLVKLVDLPDGVARAMLEQSIVNGWRGVFPVKGPLPPGVSRGQRPPPVVPPVSDAQAEAMGEGFDFGDVPTAEENREGMDNRNGGNET